LVDGKELVLVGDEGETDSRKASSRTGHLAEYQFKPGQSGNPAGRPARQKQLTDAALRAVSEQDIVAVFESLIRMATARKPSVKAAELLLAYALGRPTQSLEVGPADGMALQFTIVRRAPDDPA